MFQTLSLSKLPYKTFKKLNFKHTLCYYICSFYGQMFWKVDFIWFTVRAIYPTPASKRLQYHTSTTTPQKDLDFHLQLPSDCEQVCHNTPGSYICSCVRGYQLASDGKSCSGRVIELGPYTGKYKVTDHTQQRFANSFVGQKYLSYWFIILSIS